MSDSQTVTDDRAETHEETSRDDSPDLEDVPQLTSPTANPPAKRPAPSVQSVEVPPNKRARGAHLTDHGGCRRLSLGRG